MDRLSPAHAFKTPGDQDPGQVSTILTAAADDDDGGSGLQNFLLRLCELCERVDREKSEGEGRMRDVDVSGPNFPRKRRIFHSPFMFFFVPECALLCTLGINSRNDIMLRGLREEGGLYPGGKSCCFCFRMRVKDEEGWHFPVMPLPGSLYSGPTPRPTNHSRTIRRQRTLLFFGSCGVWTE